MAPNAPTEAAVTVARRFGQSVGEATSVQSTGIPVTQRPGQLPRYLLMLFSADYKANVRLREEKGLLELFTTPEPKIKEIDEQLRSEASAYLPEHLQQVLRRAASIRPMDDVDAVY